MSLSAEIRNTAYVLLAEKGTCMTREIKTAMGENGICMENNEEIIRAVMSQLVKKDPGVVRIGRGQYANENGDFFINRERTRKVEAYDEAEIDKLEQQAVEIIRKTGEFDWINETDGAAAKMRQNVKRVVKLIKTIEEECRVYKISLE